jgi:hypothetical protein
MGGDGGGARVRHRGRDGHSSPIPRHSHHSTTHTTRPAIPTIPARHQGVLLIYGILGFIQLNAGMHCIVITARSKVGVLRGADVYRCDKVQVLRIPSALVTLTQQHASDDFEYMRLMDAMYNGYGYQVYFSYTGDLTNTLARQARWAADVPLSKRVSAWMRQYVPFECPLICCTCIVLMLMHAANARTPPWDRLDTGR